MADDVEEQIDITLIDPEKLDEEAQKIREAQELLARKRALDSAEAAYAASPLGGLPDLYRQLDVPRGQGMPDIGRGRGMPDLYGMMETYTEYQQPEYRAAAGRGRGPLSGMPGQQKKYRGRMTGDLAPGHAPFEGPDDSEAPDRRIRGPPAGPLASLRNIPEAELRGVSYGEGIAFARDMVANPVSAIQTLFSSESAIARGALYAGGAAIIAKVVERIIRAYFEPGAPGDVRKAVLDEARTIPQLSALLDVRAGRVIMSPETEIAQFPPGVVSTDRLRDGVLRYEHLHEGLIL